MILQSLVEYYEALERKGDVVRPGWCMGKVSFGLNLSEEGQLLGVIPLKVERLQGKKIVWSPQEMKVPQTVLKTSGLSSNFLCDNSSYFLGADLKGKPGRALECFQCAGKKHFEVLGNVDGEVARGVINFFNHWKPEKAAECELLSEYFEEIAVGGNLIFQVNGKFVHKDEAVIRAWEDYREKSQGEKDGVCSVTGRRAEIARIHGTIKGVQGAQSSGAALVSFNAPAFESYGKAQSYNAPVGAYAVNAYTTALNLLLSDRNHKTTIGDTTVVYWSGDGEECYQNIFSAVSDPVTDNQELVHGVFQNLEQGKAVDSGGISGALSMDQKFYILGIAPNAARLAVRFFYQDSFGNILRHLKEHYDRMEIVRPVYDNHEYMGIWRLLQETVNKKSRDKKPVPNMAGTVFRAVISGGRYPAGLFYGVMGRIRAEQDDKDNGIHKITRGRAAIIKAYLLRNGGFGKEEITMEQNENSRNIAYILGQEFSVLETIQENANPGINATIKDKYFNSACATPAVIFPVLFKLKNSHIRKMGNKGKEVYYEKLLGALQEKIEQYPKCLSLEEQGLFILGYYHQSLKRFEQKSKEEES